MRLIKLTPKQLDKVLADLDSFRDRLYLNVDGLSKDKADFIGEVRDYINAVGGSHIRDMNSFINKVSKASNKDFKNLMEQYSKAVAIDFGDDLDRFETWLYDIDMLGIGVNNLQTAIDIMRNPDMYLKVAEKITDILNRYIVKDYINQRNVEGQWDYDDWCEMADRWLQEIIDVQEQCEQEEQESQ